MNPLSIQDAINQKSGEVTIKGWIHRERGSNKLKFLVLRDSTNLIQCVIERSNFEDRWEEIDHLQVEYSMNITGTIKEDARAPTGFEIQVTNYEIVGPSENYPITKDQSVEFLADNRHLWLRSRKMSAILKIRSTVFGAIHDYFRSEQFYEYQSPIFQAVQCEGGSELFDVKYFNEKGVFLAQTWQLYAEPAIFSLENIYTVAPSFRAEKSKTSRHLTEYWHAEMEMAWNTFDDVLNHGEKLIKHIITKVLETNQTELDFLKRDLTFLTNAKDKPFVRMTYDEALKILKEKCSFDVEWGKDLRTLEEEKLTQLYNVPLIVTHYPKKVKAFYMMEDPNNTEVVLGVDFLAPEGHGEIIGGSQREHNLEEIKRRLVEQGENPDEYEFYLDTRKYGSVPHGGFGLGIERIIKWICGVESIKDCIPFPRTMERFKP